MVDRLYVRAKAWQYHLRLCTGLCSAGIAWVEFATPRLRDCYLRRCLRPNPVADFSRFPAIYGRFRWARTAPFGA